MILRRISIFTKLSKLEELVKAIKKLQKLVDRKKFAENFSKAAGFRNILVHDYVDLDQEKIYQHFKKDSGDIEKFMKYVIKSVK